MMCHSDDFVVKERKSYYDVFNVASNVVSMVDVDGNIYFASGAMHNLEPSRYPGLNIVSLGNPAEWKGLAPHERLYLHAEQKLLDYAKANGIDVAAIYTYLPACPNGWEKDIFSQVVEGMYKGFATCDLSMRNNGLKPVFNKNLYLSEEAFKLLKEDGNLRQKLIDFINASK